MLLTYDLDHDASDMGNTSSCYTKSAADYTKSCCPYSLGTRQLSFSTMKHPQPTNFSNTRTGLLCINGCTSCTGMHRRVFIVHAYAHSSSVGKGRQQQTDLWERPWELLHDLFLLLSCQQAASRVHRLHEPLQWFLHVWVGSVEVESIRLEQIQLFSSSGSYAHACGQVSHMQSICHSDQPAHHRHTGLVELVQQVNAERWNQAMRPRTSLTQLQYHNHEGIP